MVFPSFQVPEPLNYQKNTILVSWIHNSSYSYSSIVPASRWNHPTSLTFSQVLESLFIQTHHPIGSGGFNPKSANSHHPSSSRSSKSSRSIRSPGGLGLETLALLETLAPSLVGAAARGAAQLPLAAGGTAAHGTGHRGGAQGQRSTRVPWALPAPAERCGKCGKCRAKPWKNQGNRSEKRGFQHVSMWKNGDWVGMGLGDP